MTMRYTLASGIKTDSQLCNLTEKLRQRFLPQSPPINSVTFGDPTHGESRSGLCLGSYRYSTNEMRINPVLQDAPLELLRVMILHELVHYTLSTKEGARGHGPAFDKLFSSVAPTHRQLMLCAEQYLNSIGVILPPPPRRTDIP
jgi:hypothetical protein